MTVADLAAFAGFEAAFVFGPGVAAHWALVRGAPGALERFCVGGALGHALLLGAFIATAAAGERGLLLAYPPVVILAAWVAGRRRPGNERAPAAFTTPQAAAVAAVAVAALLLLAATSFTQFPLPDAKASVSYYPDLAWGMSFAAEALHHWPVTTPQVSGEPLRYHTFVFLEMAATAQVTDIELAPVVLRLVPASLLLLLALQLAWAARRLTGEGWAGPVAAAVVLFVGDVDLGAERGEPLVGIYFSGLFLSPSQLLGMVLFVPAVVVIGDMLEGAERRMDAGALAVLGALLMGCAGAKASILPVLLGGLVLFGVWRRRLERAWLAPAALTASVLALGYVLLYSGSRDASTVGLLKGSLVFGPGRTLQPYADDGFLTELAVYPLATLVTALVLMTPLVGLAWVMGRGRRLSPTHVWVLGLLAVSVTAFFALDLAAVSQLYFLWPGYTAAALVAGAGLVAAARRVRTWPLGATLAVPALALILAVAVTVDELPLSPLYFAALLAPWGVVLAWNRGVIAPEWIAAAAAAVVLMAGVLDGLLDRLPGLARRAVSSDQSLHRAAGHEGMKGVNRDLVHGLRWVRGNTREDAVLAVNNHFLIDATRDSRYFYYSALAERRVFLESWDYTDRALEIGLPVVRSGRVPYPRRLADNDAAVGGARAAAARLRRQGVTHVLIDLVNGPPGRPPGRQVFRNNALRVYEL